MAHCEVKAEVPDGVDGVDIMCGFISGTALSASINRNILTVYPPSSYGDLEKIRTALKRRGLKIIE
ncbi:MAG: hypothetical protein AAB588_00630 [Patescibacteria group bacterium]